MSFSDKFRTNLHKNKRPLGYSQPNLSQPEANPQVASGQPGLSRLDRGGGDSWYRSRARSRTVSESRVPRTKSQDAWLNTDHPLTKPDSALEIRADRPIMNKALTKSRQSFRSLLRLFDSRSMAEGRPSQIVLLDQSRLDMVIQPKLYANDLLDLVASHFRLKEKQYFGLGFLDDSNHLTWLQGERRVLDHDFPRKTGLLVLYFAIKFYVDTVGILRDIQTVELFYLSARQLLFTGHIATDAETVFELAAYALQEHCGDFISEARTKDELKRLPLIPTATLKQHPSLAYCEERIIHYHEKVKGTSRGLAIVNYMTIVEALETYGTHYYQVKDKKDIPWWLGVSTRGIAVYDQADKTTPRRRFSWTHLENIYHREKKFSIEVKKQGQTNGNRQYGASSLEMHAWMAGTQQLAKSIWSMAVGQHQYCLDCRDNLGQLTTARSLSEIAAELCYSSQSLSGSLGSDQSYSPSSDSSLFSLTNSRYELTVEQGESEKAEREMLQALRDKKEALEECLRKKTQELKLLCLQEGELTGKSPVELPLSPGERPPIFRRRVGTAFSLTVKNLPENDQLSTDLSRLELEVELQEQITAAAYRLATDKTVSKFIRKQRKQSYTKTYGKLNDMKKKLADVQLTLNKYSLCDKNSAGLTGGRYHHSSRLTDGKYDLAEQDTKLSDHFLYLPDFRAGRIGLAGCGASTNSEEVNSVRSGGAGSHSASSGYYSPSASSLSSRSCSRSRRTMVDDDNEDEEDDVSSFYGSMSVSTLKSVEQSQCSVVDGFMFGDKSKPMLSLDFEENTLPPLSPRRKKHFVITRGQHQSRVHELDDSLNASKLSMSMNSEQSVNSHLAMSESDLDLDSTLDDISLDGEDFRKDEEKVNTRVERRRHRFIAGKHLVKKSDSDRVCASIERGWQTFQHILLGDNDAEKHKNLLQQLNRTSLSPKDESVKHRRSSTSDKSCSRNDNEELQRKIQELLDSAEDETGAPLVRSRSFDCTHDAKIQVTRNVSAIKSQDDLKLTKCLPKSKESSPLKNPFNFITQKRNKVKTVKSDGQGSGSQGFASSVVTHCVSDRATKHSAHHEFQDGSNHKSFSGGNKESGRFTSLEVKRKSLSSAKGLASSSHVKGQQTRSPSAGAVTKRSGVAKTPTTMTDGFAPASISKNLVKKSNCDQAEQQTRKRRPSWHQKYRSHQAASSGTETTV